MPENGPQSVRKGDSYTITSVESQKNDSSRISVYVDGEYMLGVHRDVAMKLGIRKGATMTPEDVERAQREDAVYRAWRIAFEMISHRQRTQEELRKTLAHKGFDEDLVAEVIGDLSKGGYIDDAAYAAEFVEHRIRRRRHGTVRIRADLVKRGVSRIIVDEAVSKAREDVDWKAMALREARKSWRRMPDTLEPLQRRKRVYAHLARRGFDYDLIREVVALVAEEGV